MERRSRGGGLARTPIGSKNQNGEGLQARMARGGLKGKLMGLWRPSSRRVWGGEWDAEFGGGGM